MDLYRRMAAIRSEEDSEELLDEIGTASATRRRR